MKVFLKAFFKIVLSLLIISIFVVISVTIFKNAIATYLLKRDVERLLGLQVTMDNMIVGLSTTTVEAKGLKVLNPSEYEDKVLLDIPEVYINYDMHACLNRDLHFEYIKLDLNELYVIKNKDGKINLDDIKVVQQAKQVSLGQIDPPPAANANGFEFRIDTLDLRIGKVIYKDYTRMRKGKPYTKVWDVKVNDRYTDIDDPAKFARLIIVRALTRTAIAKLASFDLTFLERGLSGTLRGATKLTLNAAAKTVDTGLGLGEEILAGASKGFSRLLPF
jgi:hypothetical protein